MPTPTARRRLCAALFPLVLALSCAGSPPEVPLGPDGEPDPVLALGRDVFGDRCANCHGRSGGGGTGPRLAGAVAQKYPDAADQAAVVRNGRDQMPSFTGTLSEAQISAVVRYTREVLG